MKPKLVTEFLNLKQSDPIVSVFCWTYNHKDYIVDCLESILTQQTTFPIEIIIHDDASIDGTTDIIRKYEEKYPDIFRNIIQIENQWSQNKSVMDPLFIKPKGKFIALSHGDDYWTDSLKLQKQVDILEKFESVYAVATNASVCDVDGNLIIKEKLVIHGKDNIEGIYSLHDFLKNGIQYPTLTVMFRNKNLDIVSSNMKYLSNSFLGDWILWIILYQFGDFYFLNTVTASYRINPKSITHTANAVNRWKEDFVIRRKLIKLLPFEYHCYLKDDTFAYHMIGMAYRKNGKLLMFLLYQIRSFLFNPISYYKIVRNMLK